ncbi:MAG: DUF4424 family protein [Terracidiphilus sp.]
MKLLLPLAVLATIPVFADDGAASIAAGGLVVMGKEPRIVMAREVLQISMHKVIVDYDFRNDSDQEITTEVAFPIPEYGLPDIDQQWGGFDDFRLWVNGAPARSQVEARAFLNNKEYTRLLNRMHVDVATLGHQSSDKTGKFMAPDIERLTAAEHKQLEDAGLVAYNETVYVAFTPEWHVRKKYYLKQIFPAHKIVHVRHEYTPAIGFEDNLEAGLRTIDPDPEAAKSLREFCIDDRLSKTLKQIADGPGSIDAPDYYVDFILTTANTWKTPIEDFTLIVDRPHGYSDFPNQVSFCWNGPIKKIDANHFSAHAVNLVPKKELHIGFFTVYDHSLDVPNISH